MTTVDANGTAAPIRERILDAAVLAFAARGFRGATVDAIATDAGLTRAGLLHHFPSKQHLLLAVLQQREESDISAIWEQDAKPPLRDALVELCAMNAQRPSIIQLFATLSAESIDAQHPGHEWFARRYQAIRGVTANRIREDQLAGRINSDIDAVALASQILAAYDGLQLQWLHESAGFDLTQAFAVMLDQLLLRCAPS